ncbi:hypothetical protein [Sansalvadorimonas verongulae]|uniref:hypothetical protein n=1 Tax=Sansalvadorimonas verongulae TaxID=2172824 RepID=UPI0012BBF41A|nr:hypothetical protein [Sansalvadorimonas verongulae]MTI13932.1 hypothetical protein [Sansalvadorimonas verongulae]
MKYLPSSALVLSSLLIGSALTTAPLAISDTGKSASDAKAKTTNADNTLRLEKVISIARETQPTMRVINTFESSFNGKEVDQVYYLLPKNKITRIMTIDSFSGKVLEDRPYSVPEKRTAIPLETLISQLREKYSIRKIVRTRTAQQDGRDVRIIIYIDNLKQQHLMVVDTKTGEVISDKARKFS